MDPRSPTSPVTSPVSPSNTFAASKFHPLRISKTAQRTTGGSGSTSSTVSPVTPAVKMAPETFLLPASRFSKSSSDQENRNSSRSAATTIGAEEKQVLHPDDGLQVCSEPKPLPPDPPRYTYSQYPGGIAAQKSQHFDQFPPSHSPSHSPSNGGPAFQGVSRSATAITHGSGRSQITDVDKEVAHQRFNEEKSAEAQPRNFWQRRKRAIIFAAVILVLVIVGVVVGAVVGTQKKSSNATSGPTPTTSAPAITPTAAPSVYDNELPGSALRVDAPLAPIQFVTNSSEQGAQAGVQNYELYYNNHCGNTKQIVNSGQWTANGGIFTDAINGSDIAAINYWNSTRSMHETTVFYVGVTNTIRDKRLNNVDNTFEVGSLINHNITVNAAPTSALTDNSTQPWNSYALAAAFSEYYSTGPGARLFYHALDNNTQAPILQEMIYVLANDSWTTGTTISGVLPTSHLSMVADDTNAVVRLMFATNAGNANDPTAPPNLQEYYLALNQPNPQWTAGATHSDLLQHPSSQFALAAGAGDAYLYHVTPVNSSGPALQIQELALGSANQSDPIDMATAETVVVPNWLASDTGDTAATLFAPVSAIGSAGYVNVFFADGVVDTQAGYTGLSVVSRPYGKGWDSVTPTELPLDSKCSKPVV